MIYIEPKELGPEWDEWKKEAEKETQVVFDAVKNKKHVKFKAKIWKDLKDFIKELFHYKCAYCEGNDDAGSWMDVEHYRPKAEVEESKDHPGYYWLAYDYENLLWSCNKCNRQGGKGNKFPVTGIRAHKPDDCLENEEPLLLNPYKDKNIDEHITFGIKGIIAGKTERGRKTIEICRLDREELQRAREQEFEKVKRNLIHELLNDDKKPIVTPEMQYSAYLRSAFKRYMKKKVKEIDCR